MESGNARLLPLTLAAFGAAGVLVLFAPDCAAASSSVETNRVAVSFARGKWNRADFSVVKSWRWDGYCLFDQLDDGIVNHCPDISGEEVFRTCSDSVYAALMHKSRFGVGKKVSSTMMFDYRMAPIIVLAEDLVRNEKFGVDEFREHWEVCLYDCGVNVWHHFFKDGVQKWHKSAALLLPKHERFKPNVKYDLQVSVVRNRSGLKEMKVEVGGYTLSYINELLPDTFRAGIIACEGRNFFYDFRVDKAK